MGFYFGKSVRVGPFRVNLSRGGVGLSLGGGGFRTGMSSRRRRYTTFSIPGTGMGWRQSHRSGCLGLVLACAIPALSVAIVW